jgi:2,3-bisphosphoglycerate-independent phosphoglycerate mutase
VLEKLRSFDQWRILVAPDHPTPVERRVHTASPPPFCLAGTGLAADGWEAPFSETAAAATGWVIDPGRHLMSQVVPS